MHTQTGIVQDVSEKMKRKCLFFWAKVMNRHFTEGEVQMANSCIRKCSVSLAIRECKSKPQWDFTSPLFERLPSEDQIAINAGGEVVKKELQPKNMRMENRAAIRVNNTQIPQRSKNTSILWLSVPTPGDLPIWNKVSKWESKLNSHVHNITMYNSSSVGHRFQWMTGSRNYTTCTSWDITQS